MQNFNFFFILQQRLPYF